MAHSTIADKDEIGSINSDDIIPVWDESESGQRSSPFSKVVTYLQSALASTFAALTGATFTGAVVVNSGIDPVGVNVSSTGSVTGGLAKLIMIGYNTDGAPGALRLFFKNGSHNSIWIDTTGTLRIGGTPTTASDTGGVVVGAQTSMLASKDLLDNLTPVADVFVAIAEGAAAVRRFAYKPHVAVDEEGNEVVGDRPYNGEEFEGLIIDYAPRYGMDRDAEHPHGKSLNTINAIGDLMIAVNALSQDNQDLHKQLEAAIKLIDGLHAERDRHEKQLRALTDSVRALTIALADNAALDILKNNGLLE